MQGIINSFDARYDLKEKFVLLGKFFLIGLLIKVISTLVIIFSEAVIYHGAIPIFQSKYILTKTNSLAVSIFLLVLVYPVLEEFAFRGWFTRNRLLISISLTMLLFYIINITLDHIIARFIDIEGLHRKIVLYSFLPIGFYFSFKKSSRLSHIIYKKRNVSIGISVIMFSIIHAFNYRQLDLSFEGILALFIVLFPYPFSAIIYTYMRIKCGLGWSIVLHILNNSFILMPVLLLGKEI